jgi:hypothetical protein
MCWPCSSLSAIEYASVVSPLGLHLTSQYAKDTHPSVGHTGRSLLCPYSHPPFSVLCSLFSVVSPPFTEYSLLLLTLPCICALIIIFFLIHSQVHKHSKYTASTQPRQSTKPTVCCMSLWLQKSSRGLVFTKRTFSLGAFPPSPSLFAFSLCLSLICSRILFARGRFSSSICVSVQVYTEYCLIPLRDVDKFDSCSEIGAHVFYEELY